MPRPSITLASRSQSIEKHREFYEEVLGAEFESIEDVPSQKVRVGFFKLADVRLELLEPTDPTSSVAAFLEKRGEGLHHVAYTVDDIDERLAELKAGGIRLDRRNATSRRTPHAHRVSASQELVRRADGALRTVA